MVKPKQTNLHNNTPDFIRQPYEKPKLRTIELLADEVLDVSCKTVDVGGGASISFGSCFAAGCLNQDGS